MRVIFLFVLLFICIDRSDGQFYKNLALEGGGIRGIAYAGAIKTLESQHQLNSIQNVAGTSVGAIVGALLSVGYNAAEIEDALNQLKIQTFNDGNWFFIGGFHRFGERFGWYKGNALEEWIGKMIGRKTGDAHFTFNQLRMLAANDHRFKELYILATNLSLQKATVFSAAMYPDMEIKTAVHASMAVPLYYEALVLDNAGRKVNPRQAKMHYSIFVDGGMTENFPLGLFDSSNQNGYCANPYTLGLKLERPEQIDSFRLGSRGIAPYNIISIKSYISASYNLIIENLNRGQAFYYEAFRTIYISTGNIAPKVRRIKDADKDTLYMNGQNAALGFLKTHRK